MAGNVQLFTPKPTGTVNVVASATSTAVALSTGAGMAVSIKNASATANVWIAFGTAAVTTTADNGMIVGPGERLGITRNPDTQTYVAVVASTTAQVYFTLGDGV
jgi:hypothetical protein